MNTPKCDFCGKTIDACVRRSYRIVGIERGTWRNVVKCRECLDKDGGNDGKNEN